MTIEHETFPAYENTTDMNFGIGSLFLNFYLVAAINIMIVPELFIVKQIFPSFANNE